MRTWLLLLIPFLIGCAQQITETRSCPALSSWNGTTCCQDLDSNAICDNKDPAVLERLAQEPLPVSNPPRPAPAPVVIRRPTIITEALQQARQITGYEYKQHTYTYIVAGPRVQLDLPIPIGIGKLVTNKTSTPVVINRIYFDQLLQTAIGVCVIPEEFLASDVKSPCDKLVNRSFPLRYADYATFTTPEQLLNEFQNSTPFEVIEKQHVGNRLATLAVFRRNRQNQTLLWIDPINGLPLKLERIENGKPAQTVEYNDLFIDTVPSRTLGAQ
ncbi:hypothetical protein HY490_03645 [Candidatus Woesearchaeota archaeon]|nr:hypothetical protein [Candidatus Woesearchaeota archaeon]